MPQCVEKAFPDIFKASSQLGAARRVHQLLLLRRCGKLASCVSSVVASIAQSCIKRYHAIGDSPQTHVFSMKGNSDPSRQLAGARQGARRRRRDAPKRRRGSSCAPL